MIYAQKVAMEHNLPLHVCFTLPEKFRESAIRQYGFMLKGLQEVQKVTTCLSIMHACLHIHILNMFYMLLHILHHILFHILVLIICSILCPESCSIYHSFSMYFPFHMLLLVGYSIFCFIYLCLCL